MQALYAPAGRSVPKNPRQMTQRDGGVTIHTPTAQVGGGRSEVKPKEPQNPFTPSFGVAPLFLAGRDALVEELLGALDNWPGDPAIELYDSGDMPSATRASVVAFRL